MTVIHSQPGLNVTCLPTREPRISILHMDISSVPEDVEVAMTAIHSFFETFTGRLVTHAIITSSETPGVAQVMSVVRHVMDVQSLLDEKLKGTIIKLGRKARIASEMSLALVNRLYTPSARAARRVFEIVDTDADVDRIMEQILAHEAEKRQRKEAVRG